MVVKTSVATRATPGCSLLAECGVEVLTASEARLPQAFRSARL